MTNTKKLTKAELIALLAADRVKKYPDLYRGFESDAVIFWDKTGGRRSDLLTSAIVFELIPRESV